MDGKVVVKTRTGAEAPSTSTLVIPSAGEELDVGVKGFDATDVVGVDIVTEPP